MSSLFPGKEEEVNVLCSPSIERAEDTGHTVRKQQLKEDLSSQFPFFSLDFSLSVIT